MTSGENIQTSEVRNFPLKQIYFYLTEGCNLRCRHCWLAPKYQSPGKSFPALEPDIFQQVIREAKPLGLSGVKLTGGEPLLHPRISELLDIIRSEEVGMSMETNGVLCTPELAEKMAACKDSFVSVSIDGADAETHEWVRGVKGCFEAATEAVRLFVKAGLKPQLIMSVMKHNKDQIEAVVRMAESLGAGSVKFNIVQPSSRGNTMHEAGQTLTIEELVETGNWVENSLSDTTDINLLYSHPPAFKPLGKMFGENNRAGCGICGILGIIGVLPDGAYALCGVGETVPELIFGQAGKDHLAGVWENARVIRELREGLPQRLNGICNDCMMKAICLGQCIAQNYYSSKNLWAPFWYCEDARKAGLFPETRIRP
ncbi:SynChlorMet cassette radical SAM/SPASM protein ScmF [Desulfococcaceae bacterium HSG8]|nr:SynChlorMet cassette radical SAM/SPASM protein ScmF [Desulfococcaceae bacterium HSG8]